MASTGTILEFPGAPTTVGAAVHKANALLDILAVYKGIKLDEPTDDKVIGIADETSSAASIVDTLLTQVREERAERSI